MAILMMLVAGGVSASNGEHVDLSPGRLRYNLNPYLALLVDEEGTLSIEDVSSEAYRDRFVLHGDSRAPSFSYSDVVIWAQMPLKSRAPEYRWVVEVGYPLLDHVDLYVPDIPGGYTHRVDGSGMGLSARSPSHRNIVFDLPREWDDDRPMLMRIESETALVFPVTLWEWNAFAEYTQRDYLFLGGYFGFLLLIALYAVFLYVFTESREYLYYAVFIFATGLFFFGVNGLGFQFLWPGRPGGSALINCLLLVAGATGFLHVRTTLPIENHLPIVGHILAGMAVLCAGLAPTSLVLPVTIMMKIAIGIMITSLFATIPATLVCWRGGHVPSAFMFFGWLVFGTGISLMIMRSLGILGDSFVTLYGGQLGFIAKVVFIFAGTAYDLRAATRQREAAERRNRQLVYVDASNRMIADISIAATEGDLADRFLRHLGGIVAFDKASFAVSDEQGARVLARRPALEDGITSPDDFEVELLEKAFDSGEVSILDGSGAGKGRRARGDADGTYSVMLIPIGTREACVGAAILERLDGGEGEFKPSDRHLAAGFAGQAGLAIENAQLFREVTELAITDELTGLRNRRFFFDAGSREFHRARRLDSPLSLVIADLDDFKEINERYGHVRGDSVLEEIARRCIEKLRKGDIPCRYGGEELAFLLPEATISDAQEVAERLRHAIGADLIRVPKAPPTRVTASFGIARIREDMEEFADLVDAADKALFDAKSAGKDIVQVFEGWGKYGWEAGDFGSSADGPSP